MTEYLLAAEADRIQDLIFSSSSLREVVGGSQLLSRFCAEVPKLLDVPEKDIITSGGGSFYIRFSDEDSARRFGNQLAEAYHRATGGTLSVAEPVVLDLEKYGESGKNAGDALRQAKQGGGVIATAQMPYIAFCQSCGLGLASAHEKRAEADAQQFYLCPACRNKAAEREDQSLDRFLKPFYKEVVAPGNVNDFSWPWTAEEVAAYDPRGYVAYIVADGDGMGAIFSNIKEPEQATKLSQAMERVAREALAAPVRQLREYLNTHNLHRDQKFIPVLPLIMGGDDLFALVPAPWALDITKRLCHAFQEKMQPIAKGVGIEHDVTMTASVVFCKANYPYYLAHELAEKRLSEAKRAVKAQAEQRKSRVAAVTFEVVLGNQIEPVSPSGDLRPTLCPYWLAEDVSEEWGLPISHLFSWREQLTRVPARRRSQLRALFDAETMPASPTGVAASRWNAALDRIVQRVERDAPGAEGETRPVRDALTSLGGLELENWQQVKRASDGDKTWRGHGMLDLLRAWDWLLNLDIDPIAYEGGGR